MKILAASDIHGSSYYCKKLLCAYERECPDRLLLLGDILYHGPRNDLPREYNPKAVIEMLNKISDKIICVRGNCDTEVDQMVLDFSIMSESCLIYAGNTLIFASHGHISPPPLSKRDVFLCGHTHIAALIETDSFIYANPGSVAIPKENTKRGYITIENDRLTHKELSGTEISSLLI